MTDFSNMLPYKMTFSSITAMAVLVPSTLHAWLPGTYPASPARMHSYGFSVNNADRNDAIAFWHAVYQASEGYESRIKWTGNYTGTSGTTDASFVDDVERRLNYFRAVCGISSDVILNSGSRVVIGADDPFKPETNVTKTSAVQSATLMMARSYNPANGTNPANSHNPPQSSIGWSTSAWNANAHGNLAFGLYGPGAITEYVLENLPQDIATNSWNTLVGHRRWCLYPPATDYATGDQPGQSANLPATNVLYVSQHPSELAVISAPVFVCYPPAGFLPAKLNAATWSVSHVGANFEKATVTVTDSKGAAVAISGLQSSYSFGDPALIWQVGGAATSRSVYNDTSFRVTVSGIAGTGVPTSHSYTVTLINPDRLTSSHSITGSAKPPISKSENYTFTPPSGAESIQIGTFTKKSKAWKEDAEDKKPKVIDGTSPAYPLVVKLSAFKGFGLATDGNAFRLTFPSSYDPLLRGIPEQTFEIDRDIIAKSKAELQFKFRRGYMSKNSKLAIESSSDGGVSWEVMGPLISGISDKFWDEEASKTSRKLPKSSKPIRIRFRLYPTSGLIYTHEQNPKLPSGIFLDDITTTNCDWLDAENVNSFTGQTNRFVFNSKTAGAKLVDGDWWGLRMRTKLGGKWFPYGPVKSLTITK